MNNYMVSIDGEVVTIKRLETPLARVTPAETRETIAQKTIERVKRFDPASVPVDSPDDWVEITDSHPDHIRRTCDQVCGKTEDPNCWHWVNHTVGYSQHAYPNSRIRCRRKNLPAKQPAAKRVPVRLWCPYRLLDEGGSYQLRVTHADETYGSWYEILHDADGFYVEVTE